MIDGLEGLFLVSELRSSPAHRTPDLLEKFVRADARGAGSLDQESVPIQEGEGQRRQTTIRGERLLAVRSRTCKGGRINDDHVEPCALCPQRLHHCKGIPLADLVSAGGYARMVGVEVKVPFCLGECRPGLIHAHDFASAA